MSNVSVQVVRLSEMRLCKRCGRVLSMGSEVIKIVPSTSGRYLLCRECYEAVVREAG